MGKSCSNVPNLFKGSSLTGHRIQVYLQLHTDFSYILISPFTVHIQRFWMEVTNSAVFTKIFVFQKWLLFPIWRVILIPVFHSGSQPACPDRKKCPLLKNIFAKTAVFIICIPKSLNMRSEWGNIKECNEYSGAILNIRGHGSQKRNSFLFCSNSQHHHS